MKRNLSRIYRIIGAKCIFIAGVRIQKALVLVDAVRILFDLNRVAAFTFTTIGADIVDALSVSADIFTLGFAFVHVCESQLVKRCVSVCVRWEVIHVRNFLRLMYEYILHTCILQ